MNWTIGDEALLDLAERYGTPYYLYDGDAMTANYNRLRASLNPKIDIYYSIKANPNVRIAGTFRKAGSGVEVASVGELHLARHAGFAPADIIFSGPGKQAHEWQAAVEAGISCIIAESADEVEELIRIGERSRICVPVAIRINPDSRTVDTAIQMAGAPRQFGIDEGDLDRLYPLFHHPWIHFRGIHVYSGTQLLKREEIVHSFANTMELAGRVQERHGVPLEMINAGGGFGVPYFAHEKPLDLEGVVDSLNRLVEQYDAVFPAARVIVESGRMLTAPYGVYVARVIRVKRSKGETFVILDGGLNHHAAATFRGRTMRNNFPSRLIPRQAGERALAKVNLVGPLCTPEDCIGKAVEIDEPAAGDLVCVYLSGGYGLSYSPVFFLGHPMPAEVMVDQGAFHLIRKRGRESDLLLNQIEEPIEQGG